MLDRRQLLLTPLVLAGCASAPKPPVAPDSEVFLAPLDLRSGSVGTPRNISRHPGYDNQPSFTLDGRSILFVSSRGGFNNLYRYELATGETTALTRATEAQYSPQPLADGSGFSAIRVLNPNGNGAESVLPPVWRFGWDGQAVAPMIDTKVVGYYAWLDADWVAVFVVDGDAQRNAHRALLVHRATGETRLLSDKPGRCLARMPDGRRVSFVDKTEAQRWQIMAMGPTQTVATPLVETLPGSEDYAWCPDGSLLMAQGSRLFRWTGRSGFEALADLGPALGGPIKRLAVSPDGMRLAFVVQMDPR